MLTSLAGKGSPLHRKHGLYLDALEAHDLALAKLERNLERDRYDVQQLARAGFLSPEILRARYSDELRPYLLARHEWHDQTLEMWIQSCWPR